MKFPAACFILVLASLIWVFTVNPENDKAAEIRQIEARRFAAMIKSDEAVLNEILADDLTYTHSFGKTENKSQFIASLKTAAKYKEISPNEMNVRIYGNAAVVNGTTLIKVEANNQELSFKAKFLDVYARRNGKWQLVAWQSTKTDE